MAFSQWWDFREGLVDSDLDQAGVYVFADSNGQIVYVGSSIQVRRRLKEHLGEGTTSCIKRCAARYAIEYTSSYVSREREVYDSVVRSTGKPPRCNSVRP
jgi:hypothetical protein